MNDVELVQPKNYILSRLPQKEVAQILLGAEYVHLNIRDNVIKPGETIEFVDFPESGVISIVTPMDDGSSVEVATVGREGYVGTPVLMGVDIMPEWAYCQIEGTSWRLSVKDFRRFIKESETLSSMCHRYEMTLFNQIARGIGCNWKHSIEERCARWLLSTHDRVEGDHFYLTQEFLAMMLCVTRSGVSLVAASLQKAGLIRFARGKISIIDRAGLELRVCPCYKIIRDFSNYALKSEILPAV